MIIGTEKTLSPYKIVERYPMAGPIPGRAKRRKEIDWNKNTTARP
jgi:hypothetical protein